MKPTTLNIVLAILGVALVICLGGIIWLASANPARSIPDILVGTPSAIVAGILGLLVKTDRSDA